MTAAACESAAETDEPGRRKKKKKRAVVRLYCGRNHSRDEGSAKGLNVIRRQQQG